MKTNVIIFVMCFILAGCQQKVELSNYGEMVKYELNDYFQREAFEIKESLYSVYTYEMGEFGCYLVAWGAITKLKGFHTGLPWQMNESGSYQTKFAYRNLDVAVEYVPEKQIFTVSVNSFRDL
jgi:hypothetical protein